MTENLLLTRPFLQVASICERHILEADGALTLFRIVDRFTVAGATDEMPSTLLVFTLVVKLASGSARGRFNVSFSPIDPDHQQLQTVTIPALFEGDDEHSTTLIGQMKLEVKKEGLYWIKIAIEQEEYTRVPLRVVYQKLPSIQLG